MLGPGSGRNGGVGTEGQVAGAEGAEAGQWEDAGALLTPTPLRSQVGTKLLPVLQRMPLDLGGFIFGPPKLCPDPGGPWVPSLEQRSAQRWSRLPFTVKGVRHPAPPSCWPDSLFLGQDVRECGGWASLSNVLGMNPGSSSASKVRQEICHLYSPGVTRVPSALPLRARPGSGGKWGWHPLKLREECSFSFSFLQVGI